MSLSASTDSRCRSWATMRFAIWSSTGWPRKTIRSLSRREKMSYSRSPRALRSTTVGTRGMGLGRVARWRYRGRSRSRRRVRDPTQWLRRQPLKRASTVDLSPYARTRAFPHRAHEALRQRLPRARPLRPRGVRRRVLRSARSQRRRQDDAHQRRVQPDPNDVRRHPRLRRAARLDGGAEDDRPRRAGREPRPLPRRRGDAALPRRLLRHDARRSAAPGGRDDGRLRPAREGARPRADAQRRHAPPPPARPRADARAAARDPRRADRRRRLRAAPRAVGVHPPPALARHDDPADDALPRGGRGALRGDRADPRRPAPRARHRAGAARGVRGRLARRRLREGDGGVSALAARHRGLLSLSGREAHRVLKLWTQTVVAPILAQLLFILVFGLSLGARIRHIDGVPYQTFIVPGLITMAMIQATYANNSASVFQARFDRYLNDVLAAPMRAWEVNLALSVRAGGRGGAHPGGPAGGRGGPGVHGGRPAALGPPGRARPGPRAARPPRRD